MHAKPRRGGWIRASACAAAVWFMAAAGAGLAQTADKDAAKEETSFSLDGVIFGVQQSIADTLNRAAETDLPFLQIFSAGVVLLAIALFLLSRFGVFRRLTDAAVEKATHRMAEQHGEFGGMVVDSIRVTVILVTFAFVLLASYGGLKILGYLE